MDFVVLAAYLLTFFLAELFHELGHYAVGRLCGFSRGAIYSNHSPAELSS